MATTLADITFWEQIPRANRQRLAHYLARGARQAAKSWGPSAGSRQQIQDLTDDILDNLSDITMSLWDPMPLWAG